MGIVALIGFVAELVGWADDVRTDRKIEKFLLEKGYPPDLANSVVVAWNFVNVDEKGRAKILSKIPENKRGLAQANMVIAMDHAVSDEELGRIMFPNLRRRQQYKQLIAKKVPAARAVVDQFQADEAATGQ